MTKARHPLKHLRRQRPARTSPLSSTSAARAAALPIDGGSPLCTTPLARGPPESSDASHSRFHAKTFVMGDQREATAELRHGGRLLDRVTHREIRAASGAHFLGDLSAGDDKLSRASTLADWHARARGKRAGPRWDGMRNTPVMARPLKKNIITFGPPARAARGAHAQCAGGPQFDDHTRAPAPLWHEI